MQRGCKFHKLSNTNNFQTDLFDPYIRLTNITTPGQSGPESNVKRVEYTPKISRIGASPSLRNFFVYMLIIRLII